MDSHENSPLTYWGPLSFRLKIHIFQKLFKGKISFAKKGLWQSPPYRNGAVVQHLETKDQR